MKISAVMIVKNEEAKLNRCLASIHHIVEEIIIVDTGSTDRTRDIAAQYTDKIYHFDWINDFSAARNYALAMSTGDYNLIIDADEYLTHWAPDTINTFMRKHNQIGVVTLKNKIEQNGQTLYNSDYISRFLPKGVKYTGKIHEQPDSNFSRLLIPLELTHDGYFHRSNDKFSRNITLLEDSLKEDPSNSYYLHQIANEYLGLDRLKEAGVYFPRAYSSISSSDSFFPQFIVNYITYLRKTQSYSKGLEIIKDNEKFLEFYPDFYFESAGFYLDYVMSNPQKNINYLPLIEVCYKACIEIGDISTHASMAGTGSFLAHYNLGVFYETTGQVDKAMKCYHQAEKKGYQPAKSGIERLSK